MNMPLTRVVADLHCHTVASTHAYSTVTCLLYTSDAADEL